ncbi:hypothetical protein BU16DRAFT_540639 [Lophium mytilinum]|uniref:Apple domain-containing protein n=1 Tax=Lophium mytilinum TaxID=390894 RepID=A0A6A6QP07_9PEZI|nr:hypothetical protein BU16DRAFT_540639 [Lophium mytilinum]
MEHQHSQPERSASPVSPIEPSHPEYYIPQFQVEQVEQVERDPFRPEAHEPVPQIHPEQASSIPDTHSPIPTDPPPAYLPGPPAYTPSTTSSSPDVEKSTTAAPSPASRKRLLFGIAAFLTLVTICIIVGVTVGRASKTHNHHANPSGTSTHNMPSPSTPTHAPATTPATSGTVGIAANDCREHSPFYHIDTPLNATADFTSSCATNIPAGIIAELGNRPVEDLNVTTAYTFEECMGKCAEFNRGAQDGGGVLCMAVSYNANLTEAFGGGGTGNCFLKDSLPKTATPAGGLMASARLERGGVTSQGEPGVDVDG